MKCEIHGIEMKWEGSLQKGSMKCPSCSEGLVPYDVNRDTGAEDRINASPSLPYAAPPTTHQTQISWAKARLAAVDRCIKDTYYDPTYYFSCPYCVSVVNIDNVADHYTSGSPCYKSYSADYDLSRP